MCDLIDRQAAIDALCAVCGKSCDKSEFVYNAPQDEQVILCPEHYVLCTLPSAQPEEDCDTCKHGYFGGACCNNCKVRFPSHYERRTDERSNQQESGD